MSYISNLEAGEGKRKLNVTKNPIRLLSWIRSFIFYCYCYQATKLQSYKAYKATKLQSYKATKLQSYEATKLQSYKATKLQSYKTTKLQNNQSINQSINK